MSLFQEYLFNTVRNSRRVLQPGNDEVASLLKSADATSEAGLRMIHHYLESFGGHGKRPNVQALSGLAMNANLPVDVAQRLTSFRDINLAEALLSADNIRETELEQVSFTDLCMCNLENLFPEWHQKKVEDYKLGEYVSLHELVAREANTTVETSSKGLQTYQYFLEDYRYFFFASTTFVGFDVLLPIALGEHSHKCLDSVEETAAQKKIVSMHPHKLSNWYADANGLEVAPSSWVVRVLGWNV